MSVDKRVVTIDPCEPGDDVVDIRFTVCNDQCGSADIEFGIELDNVTIEVIDHPGWDPEWGLGFYNNPALEDVVSFASGECKNFGLKIKVLDTEFDGLTPYLYTSERDFAHISIKASEVNPFTIGANGTTTRLSDLIDNQLYSFDIGPACGTTLTYPYDLEIYGTFLIDVPYSFSNSTFVMMPDSKLLIDPDGNPDPVSVCFGNILFSSCEDMWYGIEVTNNNAIAMEDCDIRDAWTALQLQPLSNYSLIDNRFSNNYRARMSLAMA
ncbi:MAG: hypothetical protein IPJ06_17745 [Saprospiraceae bacterium]|nr:hypothetical protein [Saprospiraceae bacterium]